MANSVFLWPGNLTFSGSVTVGGQVLAADGSASAPSYSFQSNSGTGMYSASSGAQIRLAINGVLVHNFTATAYQLLTDSGQITLGASGDTALSRGGAAGKLTLTGTTPMLQLGGTTSSFVAVKQSSTTLLVRLADDSGNADLGIRNLSIGTSAQTILASATAPTVSSGFGGTPTITANGTASFLVNVGTGGVATSGVLALPTASNGWVLQCNDITAAAGHTGLRTFQTASTTTSATIESQNSAGAATAWATGSIVRIIATAY